MKITKITENEVKHLAILANLKLSDEEIKNYSSQLSAILDYIEQLNEVNTDNVEVTSSSADLQNVFREDESSDVQKLKEEKKYFKVKRIM